MIFNGKKIIKYIAENYKMNEVFGVNTPRQGTSLLFGYYTFTISVFIISFF